MPYVGTNVIVMSDAGKPLFIRFGDEAELTTLCGLIQAIRLSTLNDQHLDHGDIHSMKAGDMKMVFMSVGHLILVAYHQQEDDDNANDNDYHCNFETEAYLRMQLEHTYGQILFALTDHVQTLLANNPRIDLRMMLGQTTDTTMRKALDQVGSFGIGSASFLTAGTEVILGVDSYLRNAASKILSLACDDNKDTIFAILHVGRKLFTMIQPSNPKHQLCYSDLSMLLNFVSSPTIGGDSRSSCTIGTERWFPVCLPRLNPTGFVYVYHHTYVIDESEPYLQSNRCLNLTLISQQGSTEQFSLLQKTALHIKRELGLKEEEKESILRIYDLRRRPQQDRKDGIQSSIGQDEDVNLLWERIGSETKFLNDRRKASFMTTDKGLKKDEGKLPIYSSVIKAIVAALKPGNYKKIMSEYCKNTSALHFIFCRNIPIHHYETGKCTGGISTQCLSTSQLYHSECKSNNRMWSIYQKLSLRLRLGSASVGATMDAFDRIVGDIGENKLSTNSTDFPASCFYETVPHVDGLVYVVDGEESFFGLSEDGFQLYAMLPVSINIVDATKNCRKLVAMLQNDMEMLFLTNPLAF